MKYTRYDLNMKKKKNERKKMFLSIIIVVIIAILIGTGLYKFVILPSMNGDKVVNNHEKEDNTGKEDNAQTGDKNSNDTDIKDNNKENEVTTSTNDGDKGKEDIKVSDNTDTAQNYAMVQCGYYSKKENADAVVSQLNDKVIAVSVPEDDKYRVIAYIGTEDEAKNLDEKLTAEEFSTTKARFSIPKSDLCNKQIAEIINGYLQIIEKLKDKEVKGVKSQEFKEWVNSLEEVSDAQNLSLFNELKQGINKLPEELTKDNIESGYGVIYKVLNNFRIK